MAPGGESGLGTGRFTDIRHVEVTDSTNGDVAALARAGTPEGVVVVADHQRAGRGRRGRTWTAPPGSALLASVLVRPRLEPSAAPWVGLAAALAAVEACHDVAGVTPSLKWPNDVVVEAAVSGAVGNGTAKLAGLLAESVVEGDRLTAVVVGMGCNLRRGPGPDTGMVHDRGGSGTSIAQDPPGPGPAYLEDLAGRSVDRDDLLAAWLTHLDRWCSTMTEPGGGPGLIDAYRRRCTTLGQLVRVDLADGFLRGQAVDVTAEGHLVVQSGPARRTLTAGDVVHLRPSPHPFRP